MYGFKDRNIALALKDMAANRMAGQSSVGYSRGGTGAQNYIAELKTTIDAAESDDDRIRPGRQIAYLWKNTHIYSADTMQEVEQASQIEVLNPYFTELGPGLYHAWRDAYGDFYLSTDTAPDIYGWLKNADFDLMADPDGSGSEAPTIGKVVGTHISRWSGSDEEGIDVFPIGKNPDFHWYIPEGCPVRCSCSNPLRMLTIDETFIPDLFGTLYEEMTPNDTIDHKIDTATSPCDFKGFQSGGKRVDLLHGVKWWNEDSVTAYLPPLWCGTATESESTGGESTGSGSTSGDFSEDERLATGTKVHIRWFSQYNAWIVVGYDCCGQSGGSGGSGDSETTGGSPV